MAIKMAKSTSSRRSIAEARDGFAGLVREAEEGHPIQITRRGKTVAVLVSATAYGNLVARRISPADLMRDVRARLESEGLDLDEEPWADVRDHGPGRDVDLR